MGADDVTKIVLDTNVWLEWLVFDDPSVRALRAAVAGGALSVIACEGAREELAHVLGRPHVIEQARRALRRRDAGASGTSGASFASAAPPDPAAALAAFDRIATIREAAPDCGLACRDPHDQRFIDLAVAHRASWLLSRDRALLALSRRAKRRFGLAIVAPDRFPGEVASGRSAPDL